MQSRNPFFCRLTCMWLILLLGVSMSVAAVFDHPVNADSKRVLTSSLAEMTRYDVISGDFVQTKSIKKLNRDFVSTGTFRISKTSGVVWKTEKPFPSELTVSDEGITERSANGHVRTISTKDNPVFTEFSKTIQAVFSGNISDLETKFNVFYEKTPNGGQIGLVPREASVRKIVSNIVMDFSSSIDKVVITDGSGSPVTYEFKNQKSENEPGSARQAGSP